MQNPDSQSEEFKAHRRQLLRLGAAGMPMVLTLRASASQALISQLQCVFVVPQKTKILVDHEGRAWVGKARLRRQNGDVKTEDIEPFKADADYVFPAGSVPESYRPDACPADPCAGGDDYWSKFENADVDSMFAHLTDGENEYLAAEGFSGGGAGKDKNHSHDHDQCTDSHGHAVEPSVPEYMDCGYKVYGMSNKTVRPGDFVSENGNWNIPNNSKGLYIRLSLQYADTQGQMGGWPGISCIVSILNYLNP